MVMIIGDIGSGKSSLLMAILNEMIHNEGSRVTLSGSIAYSSQKPWIMSETVEQNILFGEEFDS
jgi:ATP-binding cassette subfamily C (CFTR/MRP) protein 10